MRTEQAAPISPMTRQCTVAGSPKSRQAGRLAPVKLASADVFFGSTTAVKPRQTRIIATLGPKSDSPEMIRQLIEAGVDVFRLNFSHGTQADHAKRIDWIRDVTAQLTAEGKLNRPVKILADIQGPKIRTGVFLNSKQSIPLKKDATVYLSKDEASSKSNIIPVTFPHMIDALKKDQRVLMDDGKLELQVVKPASETDNGMVQCQVVRGGTLKNNKGINLPNVQLDIPALSDKDRDDIRFILSKGIENIAISFVRTSGDMQEARQFVESLGHKANLIAKIEKPEAVQPDNLRGIVTASDGVMVARGDLGVEVDVVEVPRLQEAIIREAKSQGKPVIVATQMLESMMHNNIPSRADVSDIADAVKDGTDFCMLSGETAVGDYPVEAVQKMESILRSYEPDRSIMFRIRQTFQQFVLLLKKAWTWLVNRGNTTTLSPL